VLVSHKRQSNLARIARSLLDLPVVHGLRWRANRACGGRRANRACGGEGARERSTGGKRSIPSKRPGLGARSSEVSGQRSAVDPSQRAAFCSLASRSPFAPHHPNDRPAPPNSLTAN
jgi:hypothetical protein